MISLLCILVSIKAYRRSLSAFTVDVYWSLVLGLHTSWVCDLFNHRDWNDIWVFCREQEQ